MTTPWYFNRKFVAPIVVFIASMLVVIGDEVFPGLGLNVAVLQDWLWKLAGLIVFGDIGYDWITQALRIASANQSAHYAPHGSHDVGERG